MDKGDIWEGEDSPGFAVFSISSPAHTESGGTPVSPIPVLSHKCFPLKRRTENSLLPLEVRGKARKLSLERQKC